MKAIKKKLSSVMSKKGKENNEFPHDFDKEEMAIEKFPDTLEGFGYMFDEQGFLKHKETKEGYQFNAKHNDHTYNQMRYEAMGEMITDYVYKLMEEDTKLKRMYIPVDAPAEEPRSFIFLSENAKTADKLLVLIHGSGAVRAGQWSRKLIINDCLNSGTQLPFIRRGIEEGYGIIVMNPNFNHLSIDGKKIPIRENKSPEEHGVYVWKHFVSKSEAQKIAIVAHSFGGVVTLDMIKKFTEDFVSRVFAIAFTDSVHSVGRFTKEKDVINTLLVHRAMNFVSSYDPINTRLQCNRNECPCVSAGTAQHERTSWSSFDLVFEFIKKKLDEWQNPSKASDGLTLQTEECEEALSLNDDKPDKKQDNCVESTTPSKESGKEAGGPEVRFKTKTDDTSVPEENKNSANSNQKYGNEEKEEKEDTDHGCTARDKKDDVVRRSQEMEERAEKDAKMSNSNSECKGIPEIIVVDTSKETVRDSDVKENRNENSDPLEDTKEKNESLQDAKDDEIRKKQNKKRESSKDVKNG
ncbi:cotranscriptional regulator FAM172A homolog isoform X2 [Gigantopelta aegis]|nr:cotranscriptional regulator FAM172A homolog isoform X2 [Gigantopelta aegis]